jgi:MFS family permease
MKRGKALGLATAGASLSGAILPFVAMLIILWSTLPRAFFLIGMGIVIIGPLAWYVVRDWPEECGLKPDGGNRENTPPVSRSALRNESRLKATIVTTKHTGDIDAGGGSWTLSNLISTGTFWKLGMAFALVVTSVVGVMSQLKPHFADIGYSDIEAMSIMAATAFFGAIGKYSWGKLCDRFDSRHVVTVLMGLNALGLALALFHNSRPALALFILIFGFAMGGVYAVYPIIIADLFGRESFPSVSRFVSMFLILELSGYIIAGQSFDHLGSYDPAYTLFIVFDIIAATLVFSVKRPKTN